MDGARKGADGARAGGDEARAARAGAHRSLPSAPHLHRHFRRVGTLVRRWRNPASFSAQVPNVTGCRISLGGLGPFSASGHDLIAGWNVIDRGPAVLMLGFSTDLRASSGSTTIEPCPMSRRSSRRSSPAILALPSS